jgi:branched-chain amino acid transport system substrate-binding protein
MSTRALLIIAASLVVAMAGSGCDIQPGPASGFKGDAIIYAVSPRTGSQAYGGDDVAGGVKLRAWEANNPAPGKAAGASGYRVVVREANDAADSDTAAAVATAIAEAQRKGDKIIGMVGNYNSGQTKASLAALQQAGAAVVMVTPSSSNPQLQGDYFFRVCATDAEQGPAAARFLVQQLGAKAIAVLHTENDYATGLRDEINKELTRLGIRPIAVVSLKEGAPSFRDRLTTLQQQKPDAIFVASDFPDGETLLLDLQAMGWRPQHIMLSDANFVFEVPDTAGKAAEGVYVSAISPDPRAVTGPEWAKNYRLVVKHDPGMDAVTGYQAADVLIRGFEKANGAFDARAIANAVRGLDYTSLVGRIKYDSQGNLVEQRVYIFQIRNNDFVQAWPAK